jgi:hypothetical protein
MAAGLGFKEFTTGDVLTAADANGYLASQVVMVFASAAARTSAIASPQEGMISYLKDTNSTEYYSGSAWVAIGGGAAGGKVLQVVSANTTTQTANSTTTMADTTLTATITPSASTSKVLVLVSQNGLLRGASNSNNAININLLRGATVISQIMSTGLYTDTALLLTGFSASANYLDSPATTSATTYKTQFSQRFASADVRVQQASDMSSIVLLEIGA